MAQPFHPADSRIITPLHSLNSPNSSGQEAGFIVETRLRSENWFISESVLLLYQLPLAKKPVHFVWKHKLLLIVNGTAAACGSGAGSNKNHGRRG